MKNKTKIRLHLSKNLFETIAKEVLAEAKVNGGGAYTEAVKMPKQPKKIKEVDAEADTDKMKKMEEMSSKEKMAKGLYKEDEMEEMQINVAEEGTLNEIDPSSIDWSAVAAALGAIGLAPFLIDKIHNLWKKKFPKSFEKAQGVSGAISKQAGGNEPGDEEGQVKTGKFESTSLNELRKQIKNK
jgi:hypothetical protein